MGPSDDFDDACVPYATFATTWIEACSYVGQNEDACEGGGYILWTTAAVCQPTTLLQALMIVLSLLWLIQLFILLAVSADGFLANNITTMSELMGISESVAGVTLVAFGNGSPDIFAAIASVVSDEKPKAGLAFGQLLGGGMFITAIVFPTVVMIRPLRLEVESTLRNLGFYVVALAWLAAIMFTNNTLHIWGPAGFLIIYSLYAATVASGRMMQRLQKWRQNKQMIFVKPANAPPRGVETISDRIAQLERRNTIQPLQENSSTTELIIVTTTAQLQDTSLRGLGKDLVAHVFTFNKAEFLAASGYSKILQILQVRSDRSDECFQRLKLPCETMLRLTVPLAILSWSKPLATVHIFTAPIALVFAFQLSDLRPIADGPPIWVYSLGVSSFVAVVVGLVTSVNEEPRFYKKIACIVGFIGSIGWVYAVCSEVVNVVTMLGVISHLSPEILGVTIMGWTNSIGDLVADVSLARQGYAQMAIAAAFGGPLFNLLVGFGLSFTIAELQGKDVEITIDQQKIIMFGFMCVSVASSLALIVLQRFYVRKPYALYLYAVYVCFMVVLVLSESDLLNF
ncbi:CBN-NCX-6 protein [Aphelenchoides fujianensis]|nr:CBN-NCX-6 protein [Aphelenchoides fujianensis]